MSDDIADAIDVEVGDLIAFAHRQAFEILTHHRATLDALAEALIEHETLDKPELMAILGEAGTWESNPSMSSRSSFPLIVATISAGHKQSKGTFA